MDLRVLSAAILSLIIFIGGFVLMINMFINSSEDFTSETYIRGEVISFGQKGVKHIFKDYVTYYELQLNTGSIYVDPLDTTHTGTTTFLASLCSPVLNYEEQQWVEALNYALTNIGTKVLVKYRSYPNNEFRSQFKDVNPPKTKNCICEVKLIQNE